MKKFGVLAFILLCSLIIVSAANETSQDKAVACLQGKVSGKCSSLGFEEQVFSTLSLGLSECKDAILASSKNSGECWPSSGCKIKDTSLAILALDRVGASTDKAKAWLQKNNITPTDLEWYLEIDSSNALSCTISYYSGNAKIKIGADKKISAFSSSCLTLAQDSNWMKIASSCLKKKFTISCDSDFVSTVIYKKPGSNIWRVPPSVQQGSSGTKTEHELNFYCYSTSSTCSYEDNLWASLALFKLGADAKGVLPYLIALSEDNSRLFPDAFLYLIDSQDDYLTSIVNAQNGDGYWTLNSQKFYTTALALLALMPSQSSSDVVNSAKTWLEANQDSSGCWGTIKDTGFLLWALYPSIVQGTCTGTGCGNSKPDCEVAGNNFCISPGECDSEINGGSVLEEYSCEGRGGINVCCDKDRNEETCSQRNGKECSGGKVCTEDTIVTTDSSDCCLASCESPASECEQNGARCESNCLASEESLNYECNFGVCCKTKSTEETPSSSLWWLWILIILIIIVVVGIIFRHQLRMFIFKFKHKGSAEPVSKTRPPFYPPSAPQRPVFRPSFMPKRPASKVDSDLDETFRKLKEMSK